MNMLKLHMQGIHSCLRPLVSANGMVVAASGSVITNLSWRWLHVWTSVPGVILPYIPYKAHDTHNEQCRGSLNVEARLLHPAIAVPTCSSDSRLGYISRIHITPNRL
jgi:hypothetical protein